MDNTSNVLDSHAAELLEQLKDENGKIRIIDSMPDDLKQAINSINENGISIGYMLQSHDNEVIEQLNIEEDADDDIDDDDDAEIIESDNEEMVIITDDIEESDDADVDVSGLNDLF